MTTYDEGCCDYWLKVTRKYCGSVCVVEECYVLDLKAGLEVIVVVFVGIVVLINVLKKSTFHLTLLLPQKQ